MTLRDFKDDFFKTLSPLYDTEELNGFYSLFLRHLFDYSRAEAALDLGRILTESEKLFVNDAVQRLLKSEPVQYILGYTFFFDLRLQVSPAVLIPRPETEEWVNFMQQELQHTPPQKVLDIGTGSGCIALAAKKIWPEADVTGIDFSEAALECARNNAKELGLEVQFVQADIFTFVPSQPFDLIVSNPPYVTEAESALMQENVLKYEPHTALFVPDADPLLFYKAIVGFAHKHLNKNGHLYFEINERLGAEMSGLLKKNKYQEIQIHRDFYGKERSISAVKS